MALGSHSWLCACAGWNQIRNIPGLSAPERNERFITDKLFHDVKFTCHAFVAFCVDHLTEFPASMVFPCVCNQDIVEQHFAALRYFNRKDDTPNVASIAGMLMRSIATGSTHYSSSQKSNSAGGGAAASAGSNLVAPGAVVRKEAMDRLFAQHEEAARSAASNCAL